MANQKKNPQLLLVVKDSKLRNDLGSRLRTQHYLVETPAGGLHTLHLLEKHSYRLLVLIDDMEDMPAIEIISLARSVNAELPIIFISPTGDIEEMQRAMEAGANETLNSSTRFDLLMKRVQKFVK